VGEPNQIKETERSRRGARGLMRIKKGVDFPEIERSRASGIDKGPRKGQLGTYR